MAACCLMTGRAGWTRTKLLTNNCKSLSFSPRDIYSFPFSVKHLLTNDGFVWFLNILSVFGFSHTEMKHIGYGLYWIYHTYSSTGYKICFYDTYGIQVVKLVYLSVYVWNIFKKIKFYMALYDDSYTTVINLCM